MEKTYGHAIVIGGSMGGMLAARVLADRFDKVTVIERDELPASPEARKGVPQGRHVHALLNSGKAVLEELFPGVVDELRRAGANVVDGARDLAWHHFGVWKARHQSKLQITLATRPLIEWHVQRRVAALANVEIRAGLAVEGLLADDARRRITGVRLKGGTALTADLVVDAGGRGSMTPQRLEALGYAKPDEEMVGIDLSYSSRLYQARRGANIDWKFLVEYPRSPESWRAGFISFVEQDRWMVSLNGYFKDQAPTDERGFLEFARALPRPDLYELIKDATPLSDIVVHKVPTTRWRRYDRLARFPENLIVIGDGVCAFNPIFGQGISVAALEARILRDCLEEQVRSGAKDLTGLADRARRRFPKAIKLPWLLTTTLDLHYRQSRGRAPLGHSLLIWYVTKLLELCSSDARVYDQFLWTLHLERGLWNILKPGISLRVLAYALRCPFVPLARRANTDRLPRAETVAS
jgi:flavin-dependent dehydrogenase